MSKEVGEEVFVEGTENTEKKQEKLEDEKEKVEKTEEEEEHVQEEKKEENLENSTETKKRSVLKIILETFQNLIILFFKLFFWKNEFVVLLFSLALYCNLPILIILLSIISVEFLITYVIVLFVFIRTEITHGFKMILKWEILKENLIFKYATCFSFVVFFVLSMVFFFYVRFVLNEKTFERGTDTSYALGKMDLNGWIGDLNQSLWENYVSNYTDLYNQTWDFNTSYRRLGERFEEGERRVDEIRQGGDESNIPPFPTDFDVPEYEKCIKEEAGKGEDENFFLFVPKMIDLLYLREIKIVFMSILVCFILSRRLLNYDGPNCYLYYTRLKEVPEIKLGFFQLLFTGTRDIVADFLLCLSFIERKEDIEGMKRKVHTKEFKWELFDQISNEEIAKMKEIFFDFDKIENFQHPFIYRNHRILMCSCDLIKKTIKKNTNDHDIISKQDEEGGKDHEGEEGEETKETEESVKKYRSQFYFYILGLFVVGVLELKSLEGLLGLLFLDFDNWLYIVLVAIISLHLLVDLICAFLFDLRCLNSPLKIVFRHELLKQNRFFKYYLFLMISVLGVCAYSFFIVHLIVAKSNKNKSIEKCSYNVEGFTYEQSRALSEKVEDEEGKIDFEYVVNLVEIFCFGLWSLFMLLKEKANYESASTYEYVKQLNKKDFSGVSGKIDLGFHHVLYRDHAEILQDIIYVLSCVKSKADVDKRKGLHVYSHLEWGYLSKVETDQDVQMLREFFFGSEKKEKENANPILNYLFYENDIFFLKALLKVCNVCKKKKAILGDDEMELKDKV